MYEALLKATQEYQKIAASFAKPGPAALFGLPPAGRALLYAALQKDLDRVLCIVTPGEAEATHFADDLKALGLAAAVFPPRDFMLRPVEGAGREYEYRRLSVLGALAGGRLQAVCVPAEALLQYTVPRDEFLKNTLTLKPGMVYNREALVARLFAAGYVRRSQVDGPGQFSVRGDIVVNVFKELGKDLNYKDILQVDGAFSACHINYGKSLKFNGADSKNMAQNSRKNSLTENGHIDDLEAVQYDFNGTEKDFKKQDIILLWEKYWLEYINAFNKLVAELPDSIVTVYVGRHAIELGFKYLMTKKNIKIEKDHDLKELYKKLDAVEKIDEDYMEYVDTFCEKYCKYIEGGNPEYFRYPEYKSSQYFAGNCLDAKWLFYNFALILLKLLHLADLEKEI